MFTGMKIWELGYHHGKALHQYMRDFCLAMLHTGRMRPLDERPSLISVLRYLRDLYWLKLERLMEET